MLKRAEEGRVLVLLIAVLAVATWSSASEPNGCGDLMAVSPSDVSVEGVFLALTPGLDPTVEHHATLVVRDRDDVILSQNFGFVLRSDEQRPAIEVGLAVPGMAARLRRVLDAEPDRIQLELRIDDGPAVALYGRELLESNDELWSEGFDPVAIHDLAPVTTADGSPTGAAMATVGWTCPYPGQAVCLQWRSECVAECGVGNPSCAKQCAIWYTQCVHGALVSTWTERTVLNQHLLSINDCVYHDWWNAFNPFLADEWQFDYRDESWERRSCTDGQTFDLLIEVTYPTEMCWREANLHCPMGSGGHVGCLRSY